MEKINQFNSDFLFSNSSYLSGASNILNIDGHFYEYNSSSSESEADCKAIRNDFDIIGSDLEKAINKIIGL